MLQRISVAALLLPLGLSPAVASAQNTRAALLEQERAQKAVVVRPYEPGKLEKALLWYGDTDIFTRIAPHNGFFVRYGYPERPTGAGIGFGGGWRHDLFNGGARAELESGITLRNYRLLRADFSLPHVAGTPLELGVQFTDRHHPQEDFFGLGAASLQDDRVSFLADYRDVQTRAVVRPVPWFEAAARFGVLNTSIGSGKDKRFPSIEDRFTDDTAPGLLAQPDYTYSGLSAAVDYRDQDDNARAGGYYRLAWRQYSDRDFDRYSFRELDAHVQQFFPIFDKKRVIALQGRLIATSAADGQQVPFFMQPTLGGSTTLRSFTDYRFRDNSVAYFNAEYRWEVLGGLDMAVFSDLGTVARSVDAMSLSKLKHGYGIGFRFNTYKSVWMRFDMAAGGAEGVRFHMKFGKAY